MNDEHIHDRDAGTAGTAHSGHASLIGCNSPTSSKLIVVRGNSGSGKSSIAAAIRRHYGRGIAVVGQDTIRRVVLRDFDRPGAANIGLIDLTVRYALDHGFDCILEGILYASHYAEMILALAADHAGGTFMYYLDVEFDETLRRHATKSVAEEFGEAEMRQWYRPWDLLPGGVESVISQHSTLPETVRRIVTDAGINPQHGELLHPDPRRPPPPEASNSSAAGSDSMRLTRSE